MSKNVTLRLDEDVLRECRRRAVEEDKSLSRWLTDLILQTLTADEQFEAARRRALRALARGFHLGGRPLDRDEVHAR